MNLLERIENIEKILVHKFGTIDLNVIKKEDKAFFKEANERLANINKGLENNDVLLEELKEARNKRIQSRKDLEEIKNSLDVHLLGNTEDKQ